MEERIEKLQSGGENEVEEEAKAAPGNEEKKTGNGNGTSAGEWK
jgi:hypothetical protein